jgi:hypothetical protein
MNVETAKAMAHRVRIKLFPYFVTIQPSEVASKRHSRAGGNPEGTPVGLDSRLRGNDWKIRGLLHSAEELPYFQRLR